MSTNMSITGGSNFIPERPVASADAQASETGTEPGLLAASARVPATINNTAELKEAKLHGEHISISQEQVVKAIEQAMKNMQGKTTSLEFTVHEQTKRIAVKVLDRATGELIREIPPEKSLDFIAKLWENAGLLVDEKI